MSSTEVLSDRFCIASNNSINIVLSPQYMLECSRKGNGCLGSTASATWEFLAKVGAPSDECDPYTSGGGFVGSCLSVCKDGKPLKLYRALSAYHVRSIRDIQVEIEKYGPVQATISLYL